jgi:membrane-associated phospholipid phosphatase
MASMPTSSLHLPAVATPGAKYAAGAACLLLAAALYLLPNRAPLLAPLTLPLTAIDTAVPFWPASGWAYAAVYLLLAWTFVELRDFAQASRFLYACLFAQALAAAVFIACPTAYPRELFPVPEDTHPLNAALVEFWRWLDAPVNCLPSLHVAVTVLCLAQRKRSLAVVAVGVALCLSTLTFKQHYAVDLLAGLALGAASYALFFRCRRVVVA